MTKKVSYIMETIELLERENIISYEKRYKNGMHFVFIDTTNDLSDVQAKWHNTILIDYLKENSDKFTTYYSCVGEYVIDNCVIRYFYDED